MVLHLSRDPYRLINSVPMIPSQPSTTRSIIKWLFNLCVMTFVITNKLTNINGAVLTSGGVTISPSVINKQSVLSLYAITQNTIPAQGTIKVIFPSEVTLTPSTSCSMVVPTGVSVTCAYSVIAATNQIQMIATVSASVAQYFQINIPSFTNPFSTTQLSSFAIYTYDKTGTELDRQTANINLQATSEALSSVTLSPSSQIVGDLNSVLTVTILTTNKIPQNGKLYIYFPYWNPQAASTIYPLQHIVNTGTSLSCSGISTNIASSPTCTYSTDTQLLTLIGGFSSIIPAGSTLSFSVSTIKNPITSQGQSGFIVRTGDGSSGIIDQASGTITVSESSTISSSSLTLDSYIVQEYTKYRLQFQMPVPLNKDCQIEIVFPSEIVLDSNLLTVTGMSFFGAERQFTGLIDYNKNSYIIKNGCNNYQDNTLPAIIYFNSVTLPDYVTTTEPFVISVSDSASYLISQTSTFGGPTVTSLPGNVLIKSLTTDSLVPKINSVVNMLFTFQPLHAISQDAFIQISFPIDELVLPSECSIVPTDGISSDVVCSSFESSNSMLLTNVFTAPYTYQESQYLTLKISNVRLPSTTGPTGQIHIETYTVADGNYMMVDSGTQSNLFQAIQGDIVYARVIPQSTYAGILTTYNIEFKVQDPIVKGGKILVLLPSEVTIVSPSSSQCSNFSSSIQQTSNTKCAITSSSVLLTGAFDSSAFTDISNQMVYFSVSGVQNPRSTRVTSSFYIITKDSNNYLLDSKNDSIIVQMDKTASIASATVKPSSLVVGDSSASYLFTLTSPTPLYNGDQVYIQMAPEIGKPLSLSFTGCQGQLSLTNQLSCRVSGEYGVYVTLALYGASVINAYQQFSFTIMKVVNPSSTQPTSTFQVAIFDSTLSQLNQLNSNMDSFRVTMVTPATLTQVSVIHQSRQAAQKTSFVITMTVAHTLPAAAQIYITFPEQISMDTTEFSCGVSMKTSVPVCKFRDIPGNRWILMEGVTGVDLLPGTTIQLTLNGLVNSLYAAATDSFTLITRTSDGYLIDQVTSGLTVTNDCDYPCMGCATNSPSQCTACDSTSDYHIIYNDKCNKFCPPAYYESENTCKQCDSSCMYCTEGPSKCIGCYPGNFLLANTCLESCPLIGYYGDSFFGQCRPCVSPCESCPKGPSTCASCLASSSQPYYFKEQCYGSCPSGVSVTIDNQCVACDSSCKTCTGSPDVCTSCTLPLKLDLLNNKCTNDCPSDLTVDLGNRCLPCDSNCATCSAQNSSFCLTCASGLVLNQLTNQCVTKCPHIGTALVTLNNGQLACQACATGCVSCQSKVDYCTKCDNEKDYVFYQFSCLKGSCPTGYKRISDQQNVCVRDGLVCDYGYAFNDYGECVLAVALCKKGYVLNSSKTECIPVPGPYVPLVFLFFAALWTIYILYFAQKQIRQPTHVVISQLLVGYCLIQTVSYAVMFTLAIHLGYRMLMGVHVLSFLIVYILNLGFGLWFKLHPRKQDIPFKHWAAHYKRTFKIYNIVIYVVSFKLVRGLVSRLFRENKHMHGSFEDSFTTLIRPLFVISMIQFVLQGVPIMLMDVYALIILPWGYMIMVMAIDNFILAVIIFILEVIEYKHNARLSKIQNGETTYTSANINPKGKAKQQYEDNVMGGLEEEENSYMALKGTQKGGIDQTMDYMHNISGVDLTDPDKKFNQYSYYGATAAVESKSTEAAMLEHLVKKLVQERKFNEICNEASAARKAEEDMAALKLQQQQLNMSRNGNSAGKQYENDKIGKFLTQKEKRLALQTTRHHMEQSIAKSSFANTKANLFQNQLLDIDFIVGGGGPGLNSLSQTQQVNLDSARTEKFRYPGSPSPVRHALLDPLSQEQQDKQQEMKTKFREEFTYMLEKRLQDRFLYVRDWESFDENVMRDKYDDMGPESDFGLDEISNNSFPHTPKKFDNVEHMTRLEMFRENLKAEQQFSNIYFDNYQAIARRLLEQQTRRTQTYEKELGGDPFDSEDEFMKFQYDEQVLEFDPQMAQDWIQNIIEHQSDGTNASQKSKALSLNYDSDFDFDKQTNRVQNNTKKRRRDIDFELDDIMGAFDIDDFGNINLDLEKMRDNFNRLVNKHGYLVDQNRNIINQDGQIIFEKEELDEDGEIPRPYRFEKRKKQLLQSQQKFTIDADQQQTLNEDSILAMEEQKVDEELEKIKILSRNSSVDSQIGENPSQFLGDQNGEDHDLQNEGDYDLNSGKSKRSPQVSKKDLRMARAYGGQPPKPKRKKSQQLQSSKKKGLIDRQATDRLFPSLHQEEERVKKLALLSYRSTKSGTNLPQNMASVAPIEEENMMDFEKYFAEQMNEIQQNRDQEREQYNNQNSNNQQQLSQQLNHQSESRSINEGLGLGNGGYQITQPAFENMNDNGTNEDNDGWGENINNDSSLILGRLDSATTQRSIQRHIGNRSGLNLNLDYVMGENNLSQLSQIDEERNLNTQQQRQSSQPQYQLRNNQPLMNQYSSNSNVKQSGQPAQQRQSTQQNHYQQYANNSLVADNQQDQSSLSIFQDNNASSSLRQTGFPQQQQLDQRRTMADFYLPKTGLKSQISGRQGTGGGRPYERNREGRDSSLSNAGQITIQGNSKLKGLEKIYTKKFQQSSLGQNNTGGVMLNKRLVGGSTTHAGQQHKFRPMQHNFVDDASEMVRMNPPDFKSIGENEDYDTVFQGIQKAFSKIDKIRQDEKEKRNHVGNSATLEQKGMNLNVMNQNWF